MSKKSPSLPPSQLLAEAIVKTMSHQPGKALNYRQISKRLGIEEKPERHKVLATLNLLSSQGLIEEFEPGRFKLKPTKAYTEGIIDITMSGAAYLVSEEYEEDIYIAPANIKNALHGDRVKVYLFAKKKSGKQEGEVIEIVQRARTEFAGTVEVSKHFAFLVSGGSRMQTDIYIPLENLNGAQNGQKAIARITEWPKEAKNPIGAIIKVLGWPGENDTEMDSILVEFGFPTEFPKEVEAEAAKIPETIPTGELYRRRDFRKVTTFTIDPVDAKDFDDALSIQKLDNGNWEIGVHIADVTHYIRQGTLLEKEAYKRATSVYLVDRVIPMLPEKLSNGVCSLKPKEEKLCFSAVFEMDEDTKIHNEWFGKTVIFSDHRFHYEEAQKVIETGKGTFAQEILTLDRLAKKIRAARFKSGSIAFEKVEVKFHLDEKGNPTGVYLKENKDSNKLIEEFMLLANRRVAEIIGRVKKGETSRRPFVYRIHDVPNTDKLEDFSRLASKFGYKVKTGSDRETAHSLNKLMKEIKGKNEENMLEQLAIRTMSKAVYSTDNIGHYGLAFEYYTHFTSPIRRYPDMMVHRVLEAYLQEGIKSNANLEELEKQCKHSTEMEMKAAEAERASVKYKQVQFMQGKKGETFKGIISGVTEWGIFIEIIENKCEGLVRLRDIDDDYYEYDERNYCIRGSRRKKEYRLGDSVHVKLKGTDLAKKQINFVLVPKSAYRNDAVFD